MALRKERRESGSGGGRGRENEPAERVETVRSFGNDTKERDSIDPVPSIRALRTVDPAISAKSELTEKVPSGLGVRLHLDVVGEGEFREQ